MAKTQNPSIPDSCFEEFSVTSLDDFIGGVGDQLLLCPIRPLCKYLTWTEQYHPGIEGLFVLTGRHKKWVSQSTIFFFAAALCDYFGSCIRFGGVSVFEGQSTRSQGGNVSVA